MFKKFSLLYCLFSMATASSVLALDLNDALSSAYSNNIKFTKLRSEFLNDAEGLLQNKALRFIPEVKLIIQSDYNRSNPQRNVNIANDQDYFVSKAAILLHYDIFNNERDLLEIKKEKVRLKGIISKFLKNEQEYILQCIKVYLDYMESLQESEIAKSLLAESQQILKTAQKRHEIGHLDKIELLHVISETASAELEYMARLSDLQTARAKFITTFDLEPDNIQMPTPDISEIDMDEVIISDMLMNNNPELAETKYATLAAREVLRRCQWRFLPTISADLEIAHLTNGGSLLKAVTPTIRNKSDYPESQNYSARFVINMTMDIFSRNDRMQDILKARKSLRFASVAYEHQVNDLKSRALELIKNIRNIREYMQHSKTIIEHQKSITEASIEQYNMGKEKVDIISVLRQKQTLCKALKNNLNYTIKYLNYIYNLKLTTGHLTAKKLNLQVETQLQSNKKSSNLKRQNNFSS